MNTTLNWPPAYKLRLSTRVKHVQWCFTLHRGLELVAPPSFKKEKAALYLTKHRTWIEKILTKHKSSLPNIETLPETLCFPAFQQHWTLQYISKFDKKIRLLQHGTRLLLSCSPIDDFILGQKLLRRWLKRQASLHLAPLLAEQATHMNLNFTEIKINQASTQWGSCNNKGTITLNSQLLFLPEALIRYVLIHELCHLIHLNHSKAFWKKVSIFDPDFLIHRQKLRSAHPFLPGCFLVHPKSIPL
ncbi:MAG: M48 family metallopeptidase [Gammaproteobacteria bacterium]|nr:M48 family metallopeptidase [Gammaproteobacteria bacterium]